MGAHICGIQQIGIGVSDLHSRWKWYRLVFGMDIRIFEDAAEAPLMTKYTGGKVQKRIAALAMNMRGGGGFEIWQYASRTPQPPDFEIELSDIGILAAKLKTPDAATAARNFAEKGVKIITKPTPNPAGKMHFYVCDLEDNWFDVEESDNWFKETNSDTGGAYGAVIGVSDMDKAMDFYREMLGFDKVLADVEEVPSDLQGLPGADAIMRRVILTQSAQGTGPFTPLLGKSVIELIHTPDKPGRKLFENRYWGDLGFIHLCFDVRGMDDLKKRGAKLGYPFTVDSADSFDMGKAAGRFGYVEAPDGTLIEFVETHKFPIVEKWGWFMDLRKRKQNKSLPKWMLGCFRFNRVKD
ncbi:MAG: VOC family protein [Cryomorphaceae bacterium]|nr:VOC family protein [Flavobacteriales bacterium]